MDQPLGEAIQICLNKIPGVTNGPALRGHIFKKVYIAETFKYLFLMNHWPECIGIWYRSSFGRGDSSLFNEVA